MEKGEPLSEPINLLVLAENDTVRDQFIEDLRGFLQNDKYEPKKYCTKFEGHTTFKVESRQFHIIIGPLLLVSDTLNDFSWKSHILQEQFIQPVNLNAIIFLMKPTSYERFLSVNLSTNFSNEDVAKIEKNVIFIFVHNDPVSYQKSCLVDEDLWSVLERIRADLLHSKTFHYHSRLNEECCNTILQFVYKNKKTLRLGTVYSHESVLKLVRNEEFLDLLMEALFLNEDNILKKTTDGNTHNYLEKWNDFKTVCYSCRGTRICCSCSNVKTKCNLSYCDKFNQSDRCAHCRCHSNHHKIVKYLTYIKIYGYQAEQQKKYRHTLITIIVTIDLFYKENNISVGQLYHGLMERIKQEDRYSILETMYEYEMGGREKGITADECMKYILKQFVSLRDFVKIDDDFKHKTLMAGGNLRVQGIIKCRKEFDIVFFSLS